MPILPTSFSDLELREDIVANHTPRRRYFWNGALHSVEDQPAVIIEGHNNLQLQWYTHGLRNRPQELGPAWIKKSKSVDIYYKNDEIHRNDGPAMISPYETKWYQSGELHREDGPAIVRSTQYISPGSTIFSYDSMYEWHWRGKAYENIDAWGNNGKVDPEVFVMLKLKYA